MAPITEHVDIHKPQKPKLGGGGPGKIPHVRGFGGGDDGDSDRDRPEGFLSSKDRLRRYRIAIVLGVISITALFIGLTIVYIMRQGMGRWDVATKTFIHDWQAVALPYPLLFVNTSVLLLSSVTLELARRKLSMNSEFAVMGIRPPRLQSELPWLGVTVLLGCGFLAGQIVLWNSLQAQGIYMASNPSSSFFYLLTGLHALHLFGGLLVLIATFAGSWRHMRLQSQQVAIDATGWYWHFMGLLWIYIFALLHFAGGS
jgi:cytochrome c oxidase subunit III